MRYTVEVCDNGKWRTCNWGDKGQDLSLEDLKEYMPASLRLHGSQNLRITCNVPFYWNERGFTVYEVKAVSPDT